MSFQRQRPLQIRKVRLQPPAFLLVGAALALVLATGVRQARAAILQLVFERLELRGSIADVLGSDDEHRRAFRQRLSFRDARLRHHPAAKRPDRVRAADRHEDERARDGFRQVEKDRCRGTGDKDQDEDVRDPAGCPGRGIGLEKRRCDLVAVGPRLAAHSSPSC